jgi:hypothetical protein
MSFDFIEVTWQVFMHKKSLNCYQFANPEDPRFNIQSDRSERARSSASQNFSLPFFNTILRPQLGSTAALFEGNNVIFILILTFLEARFL